MLREVGAVVAGVVAGLLSSALLSPLGFMLHPLPEAFVAEPLKPHPELMAKYFDSMSVTAAVLYVALNVSKYFIGGLMAGLITKNHVKTVVITVALLYLGLGYFDPADTDGPTWMFIMYPLYFVAAGLAILVVSKKNKAAERNRTSTRIQ